MSFGERLRQLRIDAGLTQDALADRLGIKKQTISRYENSEREPNIRTAKKLADALGVSLESLVHGFGNTVNSKSELSIDEQLLISSWRQASEDDREVVVAALRKYGMRYQEEQRSTNAG